MTIFLIAFFLLYIVLIPILSQTSYKKTAALGIVFVSLSSVLTYSFLGNPITFWLFSQDTHKPNLADYTPEALLRQLEERVFLFPNDIEALKYSFDLYLETHKYNQAIASIKKIISLQGYNDNLLSQFGMAIVLQNNGVITPNAETKFMQSLSYNKANIQSLYYLGLSALQKKQDDTTAKRWKDLFQEFSYGYTTPLNQIDKEITRNIVLILKDTIKKRTIKKSLWLVFADGVLLNKEKDIMDQIHILAQNEFIDDPDFLSIIMKKISY